MNIARQGLSRHPARRQRIDAEVAHLVVMGCSATKCEVEGHLPAISLYDGPTFRVLRSFLSRRQWPSSLSVAVLSAQHGLIGALTQIAHYDRRMTPQRAKDLYPEVMGGLRRLAPVHAHVELILGKDYLQSLALQELAQIGTLHVAQGPIGEKLHRLHAVLHSLPSVPRTAPHHPVGTKRPLYFLPDWDDFLDVDYDFETDEFSARARVDRHEQHSITLMRPATICDGVLISLAQHLGSKGLLRRVGQLDVKSLAPQSVRRHFSLQPDQWAFGDCGAFSYVAEDEPTIGIAQAVSLYDLYQFDLGASVDHIPVETIVTPEGRRALSIHERRKRVRLTQVNAQRFIDEHRSRHCSFIPVGVIQGIGADDYVKQVGEYLEMGYDYIALGGLVPREDSDILNVVTGVVGAVRRTRSRAAIHLLGVFRPRLQGHFRRLGIVSFDSASYFRKAWLRSTQNYLATDGQWYSALRVPPSRDPRTLLRLRSSGASDARIRRLETSAMRALHDYDGGGLSLEECLQAVLAYDVLLNRGESPLQSLVSGYRDTLARRPWKDCPCRMCKALGIDVVIFRGLNRNKRRGAHNTLQLYKRVTTGRRGC